MSATIETLGVSIAGGVVRKFDRVGNRTTFVLDQAQARELYDALAPVLEFFDKQPPTAGTEVVNASAKSA